MIMGVSHQLSSKEPTMCLFYMFRVQTGVDYRGGEVIVLSMSRFMPNVKLIFALCCDIIGLLLCR